jgi:hypothetical protein
MRGRAPQGFRAVLDGGEDRDIVIDIWLLRENCFQRRLVRISARDVRAEGGELDI